MIPRRSLHFRRPAFPLVPGVPIRPAELREFRWSDLDCMMHIERESFACPVPELKMRAALERPGVVCTVAERSGSVCGFALHEYCDVSIRLLAVAIHPMARRLGIGRQLVGRVKRSLGTGRWTRIDAAAEETALPALLFLRSEGFVAIPDYLGHYTGDHGHVRFRYESPMDTGCDE